MLGTGCQEGTGYSRDPTDSIIFRLRGGHWGLPKALRRQAVVHRKQFLTQNKKRDFVDAVAATAVAPEVPADTGDATRQRARRFANAWAVARPTPADAPVMTTTSLLLQLSDDIEVLFSLSVFKFCKYSAFSFL